MRRYRALPAVLFAILVSALVGGLFAYWAVIRQPEKITYIIPQQMMDSVEMWKSGKVSAEAAPLELHHHDVVHFALEMLRDDLARGNRQEVLNRLRQHVQRVRTGRTEAVA